MARTVDPVEFARRVEIITRLTRDKVQKRYIAQQVGISIGALYQFIAKYMMSDGTIKLSAHTITVVHKVSDLNDDQLYDAKMLGITPSRYAFLLSCPRSGRATGWRGGVGV